MTERKLMKYILAVIGVLVTFGCSSAPKGQSEPDVVLSRSNDLKERPAWVDETRSFSVKDGTATFLGSTSIPGDDRVESGYRIAEADAKTKICQMVANKMDALFQHAEEGTSYDSSQTRSTFMEACSKLTLNGIEPGNHYYEKVAMSLNSGERVTRYKIFATISMPEPKLKEAIRKAAGGPGISEDFKKRVDAQWDSMVGKP